MRGVPGVGGGGPGRDQVGRDGLRRRGRRRGRRDALSDPSSSAAAASGQPDLPHPQLEGAAVVDAVGGEASRGGGQRRDEGASCGGRDVDSQEERARRGGPGRGVSRRFPLLPAAPPKAPALVEEGEEASALALAAPALLAGAFLFLVVVELVGAAV